MKCALTGGGTRGHVYPALAIAEILRSLEPGVTFLYLGLRGKSEDEVLRSRPDIPLHGITAAPLPGNLLSPATGRFLVSLGRGILQSLCLLRRERPALVIGTGGYVAFPVFVAARLLQIPTLVHEQNVQPGIANLLLGKLATRIGVTFESSLRRFPAGKTRLAGYPVRSRLMLQDRAAAKQALGFDPATPVLFFFGGSQGARSINELVISLLPRLLQDTNIGIIHGAGTYETPAYHAYAETVRALQAAGLRESIPGRYLLRPYFENIETAYSAADLVVGRAGAGTVLEAAHLGLATVLIPKYAQRGRHQWSNAQFLQGVQAAEILDETPVDGDPDGRCTVDPAQAYTLLTSLVLDSGRLQRMRAAARAVRLQDPLEGFRDILWELLPWMQRPRQDQEKDLQQILQRVQHQLQSPSWRVRNAAVKEVGERRLASLLPAVLRLLTDRTPAPLLDRMFGGDFRQVGFIRRNAAAATGLLHIWNEDVKTALKAALNDPYWEVRAAALSALATLKTIPPLDGRGLVPLILPMLTRDNFEVVSAAVRAYGALTDTPDFDVLYPLYYHPNRLVRRSMLACLDILAERRLLSSAQRTHEQAKIFIPGMKRWNGEVTAS